MKDEARQYTLDTNVFTQASASTSWRSTAKRTGTLTTP